MRKNIGRKMTLIKSKFAYIMASIIMALSVGEIFDPEYGWITLALLILIYSIIRKEDNYYD